MRSWAWIVAAVAAVIAAVIGTLAYVYRRRAIVSAAVAARRWASDRSAVKAEVDLAVARERADRAQEESDQAIERWRLARELRARDRETTPEEVVERWGRR